jgi:hypothetical protein
MESHVEIPPFPAALDSTSAASQFSAFIIPSSRGSDSVISASRSESFSYITQQRFPMCMHCIRLLIIASSPQNHFSSLLKHSSIFQKQSTQNILRITLTVYPKLVSFSP